MYSAANLIEPYFIEILCVVWC